MPTGRLHAPRYEPERIQERKQAKEKGYAEAQRTVGNYIVRTGQGKRQMRSKIEAQCKPA